MSSPRKTPTLPPDAAPLGASLLRSFPGPVHALVQGGTRGIGLAFAAALLETPHVATVHVTGRSATRDPVAPASEPATDASPDLTLATLARRHGARLQRHILDLGDEASIARCAAALRAHHPHLHLVLNVSGLLHDEATGMQPEKKLEHLDPEHALRAFRINALGPALMLKHLLPLLRHPERAVVGNLSARVGSITDNRLGGWYSYRATKAAQNQFTRTAAIELARRAPNVIAVALHPGTVATDLSAPFRANVPDARLFSAARAARQLLDVIDRLEPSDTGSFLAWDGAAIPW